MLQTNLRNKTFLKIFQKKIKFFINHLVLAYHRELKKTLNVLQKAFSVLNETLSVLKESSITSSEH